MTERAPEGAIATKDFQVCIANAGEPNTDERPAGPHSWHRRFGKREAPILNPRGQHGGRSMQSGQKGFEQGRFLRRLYGAEIEHKAVVLNPRDDR